MEREGKEVTEAIRYGGRKKITEKVKEVKGRKNRTMKDLIIEEGR